MIPLAAFAISGCLALSPKADYIRARDLAAVIAPWSTVDPEINLLPAPIPGAQRVIYADEFRRLATRWKVEGAVSSVLPSLCFAIPVAVPDTGRMLAAMQRSLPDARIEILEGSRQPAPDGDFEFPPSSLHSGIWNGYVTYGKSHRFMIWARVKVTAAVTRVVAAQDLKIGQRVDATQLRVETVDIVPTNTTVIVAVADAAGRVPRRTFSAGTPLRPEWLEVPKEVQRGETVQ